MCLEALGVILKGVGKMSESKTSVAPANSSSSKKQTAKMLGFGGFFAMTASMVMTVYAYPNFASFWPPFDLLLDPWRRVLVLASRARGC